jgi:hypothetical protein
LPSLSGLRRCIVLSKGKSKMVCHLTCAHRVGVRAGLGLGWGKG